MARWWMGVALGILASGVPMSARAQYLPASGGPPPMGEPVAIPGGSGPMMPPPGMPLPGPGYMPGGPPMPGPMGGGIGAPEEATPNAFVGEGEKGCASFCRGFCKGPGWMLSLGAAAYKQDIIPHLPIAVMDPQNLETGLPPPAGSPIIEDTRNLSTLMNFGPKATLTYQWNNQALEVTGFYIPQSIGSQTASLTNQVDLPFINVPPGFGGANGANLWLQAGQTTINLATTLGGGELNYRCGMFGGGFEWVVGLRYLDVQERFDIFTDDNPPGSMPLNPILQADYAIHTHNHIVGPQVGWSWEQELAPWLAIGFFGKSAVGGNFIDVDVDLARGDGLLGFQSHRTATKFAQIYELGCFVDLFLSEHFRFRAGYNALWAVNVAEAIHQVNFNLSQTTGPLTSNGTLFFNGPSLELSFLF